MGDVLEPGAVVLEFVCLSVGLAALIPLLSTAKRSPTRRDFAHSYILLTLLVLIQLGSDFGRLVTRSEVVGWWPLASLGVSALFLWSVVSSAARATQLPLSANRVLSLLVAGLYLGCGLLSWPWGQPELGEWTEPGRTLALVFFGMGLVIALAAQTTAWARWGRTWSRAERWFMAVNWGGLPLVLALSGTSLAGGYQIFPLVYALWAGCLWWLRPTVVLGTHATDILALSAREKQVLDLILEGHGNREIAERLFIAPTTVKSHVKSIFRKTGVEHRFALVQFLASTKTSEKTQ